MRCAWDLKQGFLKGAPDVFRPEAQARKKLLPTKTTSHQKLSHGNSTNRRSLFSQTSLKHKFSSRNTKGSRNACRLQSWHHNSTAFSARFHQTAGITWKCEQKLISAKPVIDVLQKHHPGGITFQLDMAPCPEDSVFKSRKAFHHCRRPSRHSSYDAAGRPLQHYAKAFPFDRLIEIDTVGNDFPDRRLDVGSSQGGIEINLIINNRAAGNAPLLARRIVREFVQMRDKS